MTRNATTPSRQSGPALEAMYQLAQWLIPTPDRFPRRQKFLLGDRIQTTAVITGSTICNIGVGNQNPVSALPERLLPPIKFPASGGVAVT